MRGREAGAERAWLAAWAGGSALAVANGAAREVLLRRVLGERAAQAASTATLVAVLAAYMVLLERRRPLASGRSALRVGAAWTSLTVAFELALGRKQGRSWRELGAAYDVRRGNAWPLVLVWTAAGPAVIRRFAGRPRPRVVGRLRSS